jgi:hypothetical protein
MQAIIKRLAEEGKKSQDLVEAQAAATAEYDIALGKSAMRLESDGVRATLIKDRAKKMAAGELEQKLYGKLACATERISEHEQVFGFGVAGGKDAPSPDEVEY